ncbi:MAG: hypothetical protein J6X88_04610 [Bacteroidales bacterium]|nr:hypothetical protein [Bacteroidales bacterium]
MKKTLFMACAITVVLCACTNKPKTIETDEYVVTIEKGSFKNAAYHPFTAGDAICFENGIAYIATRMLEENIDNNRDDIMVYPLGRNAPTYKVTVKFTHPTALLDYSDVVRTLAKEGFLKLDTVMVDSYILSVSDSSKCDPGKSDWAGSYSIRKCCGIAAIDAEGLDYTMWNVPMNALHQNVDVATLNEFLLTKGLVLTPTGNKIMKVSISSAE